MRMIQLGGLGIMRPRAHTKLLRGMDWLWQVKVLGTGSQTERALRPNPALELEKKVTQRSSRYRRLVRQLPLSSRHPH